MKETYARATAAVSVLSGLLALVAVVPPGWYGAAHGDSFVFDPPTFSGLWIERTIMPAVAVLAGLTLFVAVAALTYRDWGVAGRLRRWGGVVASVGFVLLGLGGIALAVFGGPDAAAQEDLVSIGGLLLGFLAALVGLVVAYLGSIATGVGYARTDRPVVGYALIAAPVLSVLLGVVPVEFGGSVPATLPVSAAFVVVARDLWTHPDPVPGPATDEATDSTDEVADSTDEATDSTDEVADSTDEAADSTDEPAGSDDDAPDDEPTGSDGAPNDASGGSAGDTGEESGPGSDAR